MTDKERLEKVEEIINIITTTESEEEYNSAVNAFILSHMTWTLERIKELESENRILRNVAESNKYIGEQYLEQNKRYREAIKKAIDDLENECLWDALVKLKALKEGESE